MHFIRSRLLAKTVCMTLLGLQLNMVTYQAWADGVASSATANSASQAQSLGAQVQQAFPITNSNITMEDIFPETGDTTSLQNVFGDDTGTTDLGLQANARLKTEQSSGGEAYRTLIDSSNRAPVDLSKDPVLNQADQVRTPDFMDGFKENFADCKSTDVFENINKNAHIANYKTCERVTDQGGNAELKHDYTVGILEYVSGQPNFQSCGPGCLYVWIGDVADNNLSGWCNVFEKSVSYRIINPEAIISAKLDYIQWDDFAEIYLNNDRIWLNPVGFFPEKESDLPAGYSCEYVGNLGGTGTLTGGGVDITNQFKNGDELQTFKMRVSVGVKGEIYARIKIQYDPSKAFVDNGWGPKERLPMLDMINDGYCTTSQVSCTAMPALDAQGCTNNNGVRICNSDMPPSPHENLAPLCKTASVTAQCSFYKGPMECYLDAQGVEHCPQNEGGNLNSCTQYEQNPSCGFISQKCIDGAKGETGTCYAYEEVWDCGYDTTYQTAVNTGSKIECPGGAVCMGSECFDTSNTKSGDFAYAVAMLQVSQFAEHDLDCAGNGTDVNQANECKVFKGEATECKKALGGYIDCCEAPTSVSIVDYVNLTMNTMKMFSSMEALNRTGDLFATGYWGASGAAIEAGATAVIKGQWGSVVDAASGAFNKAFQGATTGMIQQWLMQQAYNAMVQMGATGAANAVFATNSAGVVTGLGANAAMVVNVIGWVYMVYVIVDVLVHIIWECEQSEFELGAKKETRQCTFVGSYCASEVLGSCVEKRETYCCYGSVVGRIIQEQGRKQLGIGYGSDIKNPQCDGLTPTQLSQIDFNQIDLSEWIGMLNLAGRLPTPSSVDLEKLTGSGSALGNVFETDQTRLNTLDRNMQRLESFDVDAVKKKAELEMQPNLQ